MTPEQVGETLELSVEDGEAGDRLDHFVATHQASLSRAATQRLIAEGFVRIDGRPAKASHRVTVGDRISVAVPAPRPVDLVPSALPLNIVYEDADLLVVDKPAGLVVHPAPGHVSDTLVNALLARYPDLSIGGALRPGIVHRLDKDTSGLMVVAKNDRAMAALVAQMKARAVLKEYLALVEGHLPVAHGVVEAPIGRDPKARKRMAVVSEGREASTEFTVVEQIGEHSLIRVRIQTGRTHQIRVHLASIGNPVEGDEVYGHAKRHCPNLHRQFLHATRLGFRLPSNDRFVTFESPLPADLAGCLEELRATRR